MAVSGLLVIVQCGQIQIWDKSRTQGPTEAHDCFPGPTFKANRMFAEKFGEAWVILSAKYGFIAPTFVIPERYSESLMVKTSNPVSVDLLREQVRDQHLDRFDTIIGLGSKEYRSAIQQAFVGRVDQLYFPFSTLRTGKVMQATYKAFYANDPFFKGNSSSTQ